MEYVKIFLLGYLSVFALGFQSRNVNHGNYLWAALTSFWIGISSAHLWTKITAPDAGSLAGVVYGISGALAITSAMKVHERLINRGTNDSR